MANATGIYVKDWRDGSTYHDWAAPSAGSWAAIAGYGYGGQNWVTAINFRVTSPASAVSFSWVQAGFEGGSRDIRYKITEGEDNTYINATASTAGDGMITATSGSYNRTTLNVTKNLKANTDYVLYLWTDRNTSYQNYTTLRIWNSTEYPFRVTYTEAASYSLSLSVGANVTGSVTLNSSPFGRTGTVANNGTIYAGEVLKLTYTVSTGYAIDTHTLNGSTVNSGDTHTVAAAVSIILTAKASLSTISTGNGTFGSAQTITVTRYNSSYTHTIKATCAGSTQTIVTKSSYLSISWTPQNSFMNGIPNVTSAACVLTCETYSGNTLIGSNSITVTLSVPASVKPAPSLSVSDSMGYASTYGGYVQGKSKAAVVVTDGNQYSATTASRSTTANGATYSAASFTTGALRASGANSISTTIKDSRGRTGTASTSITVLAYSAPAISAFGVHRCDSDGTANDSGNYFKVTYTAAVTALNNHNSKTLKFHYRQVGGAWGAWQTLTMSSYSQSGSSSAIDITTGVANGTSYDVEISLQDDFSTITRSTTLSTMPVAMDWNEYGDAVGFGKAPAFRKAVDIGDWSAIGRVLGLGRARSEIPSGGNLNDYTEPGVYGIVSTAIATTLSNRPCDNPGTLRVWNAMGDEYEHGRRYHMSIQEYVDTFGSSYTRRCVENPVGTLNWTAWTTPLVLGGPNNTIPENSDLDGYVRPGVYGVTTNTTAASLAHCPTTSAGTLRVWNALGSSANPGDTWYYVEQEYTTAYTDTWRRCGETGSGTTVTWGAWSYYAGQLSVLKSNLGLGSSVAFDYKSAANGSSLSWTFGRAERGAVIVASASSNGHDIIIYNNSASNSTSTTRIRNATGITVTGSGGTLTIANSTGVYIYALRISWA